MKFQKHPPLPPSALFIFSSPFASQSSLFFSPLDMRWGNKRSLLIWGTIKSKNYSSSFCPAQSLGMGVNKQEYGYISKYVQNQSSFTGPKWILVCPDLKKKRKERNRNRKKTNNKKKTNSIKPPLRLYLPSSSYIIKG